MSTTLPYTHAICIDPGASGGASLTRLHTGIPEALHTFYDGRHAAKFVSDCLEKYPVLGVVIENVHATPIMGPSSAFAFGSNFGLWLGIIASWDLGVHGVTPQEWQKLLAIPSEIRGDDRKRALKAKAIPLFPEWKMTMANCDAALLGHVAHIYAQSGRLPGKELDL